MNVRSEPCQNLTFVEDIYRAMAGLWTSEHYCCREIRVPLCPQLRAPVDVQLVSPQSIHPWKSGHPGKVEEECSTTFRLSLSPYFLGENFLFICMEKFEKATGNFSLSLSPSFSVFLERFSLFSSPPCRKERNFSSALHPGHFDDQNCIQCV